MDATRWRGNLKGLQVDALKRKVGTPPKFNSEFTPENGWLEYFLVSFLGRLGLFSGAFAVSFREGMT